MSEAPALRVATSVRVRKPKAGPAVPADWRMHILRLVDQPGLEPHEANELRKWLARRVLPPTYWAKVQAFAARIGPT